MRRWRSEAGRRWGATTHPTSPARLWSLDLETTGLDRRVARILSVGMVPLEHGVIRLGHAYRSLVSPDPVPSVELVGAVPGVATAPGRDPDRAVFELARHGIEAHHLRPVDVRDAPPLAAVLPEVLVRLRDGDGLLVHHAPLDVTVLRRSCAELGVPWPDLRVVDTARLLDRHNRRAAFTGAPTLPTQLTAARAALGLPLHDAHDALADAVATAELYLVLRARSAPRR